MHVNSVAREARWKYFSVAAGLELTTGRSRLKGTSCGSYALFAGGVISTESQDTPSDIVELTLHATKVMWSVNFFWLYLS